MMNSKFKLGWSTLILALMFSSWFIYFFVLDPNLKYDSKLCLKTKNIFDSQIGQIINAKMIYVNEGQIVSLKSCPENVEILDLSNLLVLPGLIDLHSHLFLNDESKGKQFSKELLNIIQNPEAREKLAMTRGQELLLSGFTTVRDLGNAGEFLDIDLRKRAKDASFPIPYMVISGKGIAPEVGQFEKKTDLEIVNHEYLSLGNIDSEKILHILSEKRVDWLKLYADEDPSAAFMKKEDLQFFVSAARNLKLPIAAHAVYPRSIGIAISAGVDTIEHGTWASTSNLEEMAKNQIWLIPTDYFYSISLLIEDPNLKSQHEQTAKTACQRLKKAKQVGVPLGFGSDIYFEFTSQISFASLVKSVLTHYVKCGLTASEAVQTATFNAGKVLNLQGKGRIVEGAVADLIAVEGDPVADIDALGNVRFVMKAGFVHKYKNGFFNKLLFKIKNVLGIGSKRNLS